MTIFTDPIIILQFIQTNYNGEDPVPLRKIVNNFRSFRMQLSYSAAERIVRRVISEAHKYGYPIGSHPAGGYMLIKTQEELDKFIANIQSRINKLWDRKEDVTKAFQKSSAYQEAVQEELF